MRWRRWFARGLIGLGLIVLAWGVGRFYTAAWTGFAPKVLWDWLELLLIPAVLTGGGIWFTRSENRQAREIEERRLIENRRIEEERLKETRAIEEKRLEETRAIEHERTQDTIVKDYLDQMTDLLLTHKLRKSAAGNEVRSVASARTLAALSRIDGHHKRLIIQFLYTSELIGYCKPSATTDQDVFPAYIDLREVDFSSVDVYYIYLAGADFSGVEMQRMNGIQANFMQCNFANAQLSGGDLPDVCLAGANLSQAVLYGVVLSDGDLRAANFSRAVLDNAHLANANLENANMERINLVCTNLTGANLSNTMLRSANLRECTVTLDQLLQAQSLHGATLPDHIDPTDLGDLWSPPRDEAAPSSLVPVQ